MGIKNSKDMVMKKTNSERFNSSIGRKSRNSFFTTIGKLTVAKIVLDFVIVIIAFVLVMFIIGYMSNPDLLDIYNSLGSTSTSNHDKKLSFVSSLVSRTGNGDYALALGFTSEDVDEMINSGGYGRTPQSGDDSDESGQVIGDYEGTVSEHGHIAYRQTNYKSEFDRICLRSDGTWKTISSSGCGWVSLTTALAELNPDACSSLSPRNWLSIISQSTKNEWSGNGMSSNGAFAFINEVNDLGTYGRYQIVSGPGNTTDILNFITEHANNEDEVILVSSGIDDDGTECLFTSGGHIILATDLDESGSYFHISDSSGRAASKLGVEWDIMSSYNFPLDSVYITNNGTKYYYEFKASWLIKRVE